jgi:hypothetical protein
MGGGSQEIEGMNAAGWPMDELVVGGQLTSNGKVRNGVICCKKRIRPLRVPKIRFCNIGGEGHRELGVT